MTHMIPPRDEAYAGSALPAAPAMDWHRAASASHTLSRPTPNLVLTTPTVPTFAPRIRLYGDIVQHTRRCPHGLRTRSHFDTCFRRHSSNSAKRYGSQVLGGLMLNMSNQVTNTRLGNALLLRRCVHGSMPYWRRRRRGATLRGHVTHPKQVPPLPCTRSATRVQRLLLLRGSFCCVAPSAATS